MAYEENLGHMPSGRVGAIYYHTWYQHMSSSLFLFISAGCFYASQIIKLHPGQTTPHRLYPHMDPQKHKFCYHWGSIAF